MRDLMVRIATLGELMAFLWRRRLFWLIPMITALIILALLLFLRTNPLTSPLTYPIF